MKLQWRAEGFGSRMVAEDYAMERFIQLNLRSDSEKAAADNSPNNLQYREQEAENSLAGNKRLNKMLKKAAHKASTEYGRGGKGGIFSK